MKRAVWQARRAIPAARAEELAAAFAEAGEQRWQVQEDLPSRRAWVVGYFTALREGRAAWTELARRQGWGGVAAWRRLAARDWRESYKEHFRPWRCGPLHWVPVWERRRHRVPRGEVAVWLDPGMAFGTGGHATTRLCAARLVEEAGRRGDRARLAVIDAGCGSGILALSAVRLGFGRVSGFDHDPEAVRISRENAARNGLAGRVRFATAGLASGLRGRRADVLLANIQADVLIANAAVLVPAVAPGGALVLSGVLATEQRKVRAAFAVRTPGWRFASRTEGEWSDLVFRRPR